MTNEVISYLEMCQRESSSLQRGMNFRLHPSHSVMLVSVRPNAPYNDRFEEDGTVLIYEGHDEPRSQAIIDPKSIDQPMTTLSGRLTQNGLFYEAAQQYKLGLLPPERVRIYEKLRQGIWIYNGVFYLEDAWVDEVGDRHVFKFKLVASEDDTDSLDTVSINTIMRRRIIPTAIKLEVWKRDEGRCVMCGQEDELHFDHILPFSKGGTSVTAKNVQLLCARHNLAKSDKIQ